MALDKLLENEAQAEIARIREAAQQEAQEIVAQAQARAQELLQSRQRAMESDYAAGLTRARSAADLESNAQRLAATDSLQSRAFETAQQYLHSATTAPEYPEMLSRLIQQGLDVLPQATTVEAALAEHDAVRQALAHLGRHLDVRVNESVKTGVRLVGEGGKTSIQNTLVGRLERVRGELAPQISRLLAE